jgi:hypothetical protein
MYRPVPGQAAVKGLSLGRVPTAVTATRVVLSYPADLSAWGRDQLRTPWMQGYLRRTLGDAVPGDDVAVFLDVGCCGGTLDVPLRVERIAGDGSIGEATVVEFEERAACGLAGGWEVQSRAGRRG